MSWGSVLTQGLPETVPAGGTAVPIETDYRLGLLMGELAEDPALTDSMREALLLRLYCLPPFLLQPVYFSLRKFQCPL